jgi:phosphoglycolate phosphatase/pyrophosphatase PpaX
MRAIVFDWDGTLADTLPLMFVATEEVVAGFGLHLTWDDYCRLWTPDWRALYRSVGLPEPIIEEAGRRWWAAYRGREEADLLPGAAEALDRLHAAGYPLALVTAGHRDNVGGQLRRHGLESLLPVRVHGDDLPETKPHPAPLLRAIRELGLGPGAAGVAYVGDALDDMRMARAAGAHAVGIDSGLGDETALRAAGAAETAASVAAWVDRFLDARV